MGCVLGVDAGNTKTLAIVAGLDGGVLGSGRAECGDIYAAAGADAAIAQIRRAAVDAMRTAGVAETDVRAAVYSAAGADWPEDFALLEERLRAPGHVVRVVNDGFGALRAGSPTWTGVAIVCGTYTATAARSERGVTWHAGFWQEPSGARELGREALHAVYRAELGIGPETQVTRRVLGALGVRSVEEVVHYFSSRLIGEGRLDPAALARPLLDAAEDGDGVAREIVRRHAVMLAEYGVASARRVGLSPAHDLVLSGGVFRHGGSALRDGLVERYRCDAPDVEVRAPRLEPAYGAVLLALEEAGVQVGREVEDRLVESGPGRGFFAS